MSNVDLPSDLHIIHSGTKLYSVTPDFKTETELLSGLADVITQKSAFYMNNYCLVIFQVKISFPIWIFIRYLPFGIESTSIIVLEWIT